MSTPAPQPKFLDPPLHVYTDCSRLLKLCPWFVLFLFFPPTEQKPGFCPVPRQYDPHHDYYYYYTHDYYYGDAVGAPCAQECETDADCPSVSKCCYNGCGSQCLTPESGMLAALLKKERQHEGLLNQVSLQPRLVFRSQIEMARVFCTNK